MRTKKLETIDRHSELTLDGWLEAAKTSLAGPYAKGVEKDIATVRNAINSPSSDGQTEGETTRQARVYQALCLGVVLAGLLWVFPQVSFVD